MARASADLFITILLQITVVLGVGNHTYDRSRRQFVYSPRAFIFRASLHATAFLVLATNYNQLLSDARDLVSGRDFVLKPGLVCTNIGYVYIASGMITEWWNRGRMTQLVNELLGVRIADSLKSTTLATIRVSFWKLFLQKSVSIMCIASTFVSVSATSSASTAYSMLSAVSMVILLLVPVTFQYQLSVAMLYGGYLFKALNTRLSQLVAELNDSLYLSPRKSRRLSEELGKLGALHTNLRRLMIGIKDIYQFDMLVTLTSTVLYQAFVMFYFLVAARGLLGTLSTPTLIFQIVNSFLGYFDLLLDLHNCAECVVACNASGGVLKGLTTFLVCGSCLERDIDVLSLQLARERLQLTIYGMFDLDASTGPSIFKEIMIYLILLTQLTYHEL